MTRKGRPPPNMDRYPSSAFSDSASREEYFQRIYGSEYPYSASDSARLAKEAATTKSVLRRQRDDNIIPFPFNKEKFG